MQSTTTPHPLDVHQQALDQSLKSALNLFMMDGKNEFDKTKRDLETRLINAEADKTNLGQKIQWMTGETSRKDADITNLKQQLASHTTTAAERDDLKKKLEVIEKERDALSQGKTALEAAHAQLQQDMTTTKGTLATLQQEHNKLRQEMVDLSTKEAEASKKAVDLEKQLSTTSASSAADKTALTKQLDQVNAQHTALLQEKDRLIKEHAALLQAAQNDAAGWQQKHLDVSNNHQALSAKFASLEGELKQRQAELGNLTTQKAVADQRVVKLEQEIASLGSNHGTEKTRLEAELTQANQERSTLQQEIGRHATLLQAAQNDAADWKQKHGTLEADWKALTQKHADLSKERDALTAEKAVADQSANNLAQKIASLGSNHEKEKARLEVELARVNQERSILEQTMKERSGLEKRPNIEGEKSDIEAFNDELTNHFERNGDSRLTGEMILSLYLASIGKYEASEEDMIAAKDPQMLKKLSLIFRAAEQIGRELKARSVEKTSATAEKQ
nr:uncharacterized protein [uncultured bacterium]